MLLFSSPLRKFQETYPKNHSNTLSALIKSYRGEITFRLYPNKNILSENGKNKIDFCRFYYYNYTVRKTDLKGADENGDNGVFRAVS